MMLDIKQGLEYNVMTNMCKLWHGGYPPDL